LVAVAVWKVIRLVTLPLATGKASGAQEQLGDNTAFSANAAQRVIQRSGRRALLPGK
jgi:hypothetical protein